MIGAALFLAAPFHVSSAILPATARTIIIMRIVCKDVHIFVDTAASRHAAMTNEVIEQVVHLQVQLKVVVRLHVITAACNLIKGLPALQLGLEERADKYSALAAVNEPALVALYLLTSQGLLVISLIC